MSYYVTKPQMAEKRVWIVALSAALLVVAVALAAGYAAARPLTVVVDGTKRYVTAGTTIADLERAGTLSAASGRLIGVDGSIIEPAGGEKPAVQRNGEPARLAQRLYAGDIIASAAGADLRESLVLTDVPIPFKTEYRGTGSLADIEQLGSPGKRRVTRGAVSGVEVSSTVTLEPSPMVVIRSRPKGGKLVAITFDDGPWPSGTVRVLKVLKDQGVHATFFMLGRQVKHNPELARRVAADGHQLASHSYSHKELTSLSSAQILDEIHLGRRAIDRATGVDTAWLRPPYGAIDGKVWKTVRATHTHVVLWDVDSRDWTKPGAKKIVNTVLTHVRPGSVVLFHDGGGYRGQTVAALPKIIRVLKQRGYTFVTVEELSQVRSKKR